MRRYFRGSIAARFAWVVISLAAYLTPSYERTCMAEDSLYALSAHGIDGAEVKLSTFQGKVALVVNVASQCGFTRQYSGLQELFQQYGPRGFVVLGFPSNDFGGQEPGSNEEIKSFCSSKFGVTFPMFAKVTVEGGEKHPVYRYLTSATGGDEVGWNFEKFLVDKNGRVIGRFKSSVRPDSSELKDAIEQALK
jgi:glutathione peroxidase